jgi:hypothetical protein
MRAEDYEKMLNDGFAEKLEQYFGRKKDNGLEKLIEKKGG